MVVNAQPAALRRLIDEVGNVDQVGVEERVAKYATRSIKKAAKVEKGSSTPHTEKVGKLTRAQAEEIAKTKMPDLNADTLESAIKTVAGTARSMGLDVIQ